MRRVSSIGLVVFLTLAVFLTTGAAGPPIREIEVFNASGYTPFVEKVVNPIMSEKYNCRVLASDKLAFESYTAALAQKDNPRVSVVTTDDANFLRGVEQGMWQRFDPNVVTNAKNIQPAAYYQDKKLLGGPWKDWAVPVALDTVGIQYNTDVFVRNGWAPPTGFADLWRPEFKGKVGLTSTTSGVGLRQLIMFAKMRGGNEYNIDPGFAAAKELVTTGQVGAFAPRSSTFNQLMEIGEIVIGVQFSEGALIFQSRGAPVKFVYPKEGVAVGVTTYQIMNKAPSPECAQHFLNLLLSAEFQKELALQRWAVPVRQGISLPTVYADRLPLTPRKWQSFVYHDALHVAKVRGDWHERWIREVEGAIRR